MGRKNLNRNQSQGINVFSSRISLKSLAIICRSLSTTLGSGVAIHKAFELAAGKSGNSRGRQALREIAASLRNGNDIASSMRSYNRLFPPLMIDMVAMAEQTGMLPEVLANLSDHYDNNLKLRKTFLSAIAWPLFQLMAAILVIAFLILILGVIADAGAGEPLNLLWGLSGPKGAIIWLTCTCGSIFSLFVFYKLTTHFLGGQPFIDPFLMKIPVLGHCMRSFAIARFSWAFYLTQQTGMPIQQSIETSLRATTNGAFIAKSPSICKRVAAGEDLTVAFRESGLFPEEFLEMVLVGETAGTVPEMLNRLSPQFQEQARRSLAALAAAFGWLVWMAVSAFIIFFIFTFILWYVDMINDAAKGL